MAYFVTTVRSRMLLGIERKCHGFYCDGGDAVSAVELLGGSAGSMVVVEKISEGLRPVAESSRWFGWDDGNGYVPAAAPSFAVNTSVWAFE